MVVHIGPYGLNTLDGMLEKAGKLPASNGRDWEEFQRGHIYVARRTIISFSNRPATRA